MGVVNKNLHYLLFAGIAYFGGCAQKSEQPKTYTPAETSIANKNLESEISYSDISKNEPAEEKPVFKKEMSKDSSFLSISGYSDQQKEELILNYSLINHQVDIHLKRDNGTRVNISGSVSRQDIITWGVEINRCTLESIGGERISFSNSLNIDSPARGNLNFTDMDFWKVKHYAGEKTLFYLNKFEKDIDSALEEAHKRYMGAERDFKRIEDFFE